MSKTSSAGEGATLVTESQMQLARSRQALVNAYRNKDWQGVRACDIDLAVAMNAVFDDERRDNRLLINELEKILLTYAQIIAELPEVAIGSLSNPGN